ncbi:MAG: 3-hydroxyacyl-CoA dehydrogenase family protein [Rhodococcus sp.]|nr:3-hydroxyacyl-CoA dehydrogenase family protein [Rhodococcus sp. (in: high G+C Gram-positive bacteria)]
MGAGIVDLCARAGLSVLVLDQSPERLDAGHRAITEFHAAGIARGLTDPALLEQVTQRITGTVDPADLAAADLIVEAVTEDEGVKAEVLGRVATHVSEECVIASNTSGLSVTRLATYVSRPERFGGLHFFNPAQLMRLVEVIRPIQADKATVGTLVAFAERIDRHPVVVKDRPGFLVNHLLIPYLNQAIQEYDDGLATCADLATAVKLGLGYPMGPLQLLDRIGLDTHLHATGVIYEDTADPGFAAPALLRELVAAGRLGRKTGSGISDLEDPR